MANSNEAMREALARMLDWMEEHTGCYSVQVSPHRDDPDAVQKEKDEAISRARAALALPRRNCDVGAPEEQEKRFNRFCGARHLPRREVGIYCAYKCPVEGETSCELQWAQMPYTESEATDGK